MILKNKKSLESKFEPKKNSLITKITFAVLVGGSLIFGNGCRQAYWGKSIQSYGYTTKCNNPNCPGHALPGDRCEKSIKECILYPFK